MCPFSTDDTVVSLHDSNASKEWEKWLVILHSMLLSAFPLKAATASAVRTPSALLFVIFVLCMLECYG